MAQNFIACDREQALLLPPSLREWLPEDHLAWFVLDAVEAMDLRAFFAGYRDDGWGRAAHDPAMMVALLIYAYAIGERSSRRIERRCHDDVAVRVIAANQAPDHTTIARFRQRHERPLSDLFGEVFGVPPVSWTLDRWAVWPGSKDRCPCRQRRRIRLSSVGRRSGCSGRAAGRCRSSPRSSGARRSRSETGRASSTSTRARPRA